MHFPDVPLRRTHHHSVLHLHDASLRLFEHLSAGGSKYPIDLLKEAGVDMTTDEPLELTIRKMNRVMDEMERLMK